MEKTGEMNLYLYVDGRGRMTIPSALRCRTGMGKNSFVRARLYGSVVQLTHVTPREAAQMTEEELLDFIRACALPGFVDSKNEEKTERNAGYLVVSQSGGGMLRQGTREGIRRTPANRGMRAHRIVKGLDISEDVCHGMCP